MKKDKERVTKAKNSNELRNVLIDTIHDLRKHKITVYEARTVAYLANVACRTAHLELTHNFQLGRTKHIRFFTSLAGFNHTKRK